MNTTTQAKTSATGPSGKRRANKKAPSAEAAGMPDFGSMVELAIAWAERVLGTLISLRCSDENWDDVDSDVDMAVELARGHVARMKEMRFEDINEFNWQWFMASGAVNLAAGKFSRPDCRYGWTLKGARAMFESLPELVEFPQAHTLKAAA